MQRAKSNLINIAFNYFPAYTEESPVDQRNYLIESIKKGWLDTCKLKNEIKQVINDSSFSWKDVAQKEDFIHYTEAMTEKEVLIAFKLLIWDVIFEDEVFGEDEIKKMQTWLYDNLSIEKQSNFKDLIEEINKEQIAPKLVDEYELLRAYYSNNGYNHIFLEHKNGTEEWFYSLKPKPTA